MFLVLAPIDGYTDCAFREIVKKYGNPDMMFTEFVNAQGLIRATDKLIHILRYTENQRPIIAQLFGKDPKYFYKAALLCSQLGFDGIDINMGCPAKNIASKGGGAALIKKPKLVLRIIEAVKKAVKDYKDDQVDLDDQNDQNGSRNDRSDGNDLPDSQAGQIDQVDHLDHIIKTWKVKIDPKREISVSVKTRTGYDKDITEKWIKTLAKAKPDFITLHARTLKQGYKGRADWGAIKRAVEVTDIPIIGNGDVKSYEEAVKRQKEAGCWGVMIGRGSFGKPWVFKRFRAETLNQQKGTIEPTLKEVKQIALEHAELFVRFRRDNQKGSRLPARPPRRSGAGLPAQAGGEPLNQQVRFYEMRKHLMAYFKGFPGAKELRVELSQVNDVKELEKIFEN
jgi:tRNA-dihydrouridine synthase B